MKSPKCWRLLTIVLGLQCSSFATVINFDSLDASAGALTGSTVTSYLAGFGVTVSGQTGGTQLIIADDRWIYGGNVVLAPSAHNVLGQQGIATAASFTLNFSTAVSGLSFDRVGILGAINPSSFPQWSATAFDANNVALGTVGEGLNSYFYNLPAQTYSFGASGITSIRFDGNAFGFAGFTNVLIDNLSFTPSAVPDEASTLGLLTGAMVIFLTVKSRRSEIIRRN